MLPLSLGASLYQSSSSLIYAALTLPRRSCFLVYGDMACRRDSQGSIPNAGGRITVSTQLNCWDFSLVVIYIWVVSFCPCCLGHLTYCCTSIVVMRSIFSCPLCWLYICLVFLGGLGNVCTYIPKLRVLTPFIILRNIHMYLSFY